MKRKLKLLILIVLIGLISGCKKDSPISNPPVISNTVDYIDPDFIFYPTKNAIWIYKSYWSSSIGEFNFLDTLYLGKDTMMISREDVDPPSAKSYKEVIVTTVTISPTNDTTYSLPHRYGWFRQDTDAKKIFAPRLNTSDNMIYDELMYNFNLCVGDTFTLGYSSPLVVKNVDSIAFGNRYLKHILYGYASESQTIGGFIQAFNIYCYNLTDSGSPHPGNFVWKKFIYKTDTLIMTY